MSGLAGGLGAKHPGLGSLSDLADSCATLPLLNTWRVSTGHQRSVETVSFSHDSKQLASGGWDKRVMLWEVQVCGGAASEAWDPKRPSSLVTLSQPGKVVPSLPLPMRTPGVPLPCI